MYKSSNRYANNLTFDFDKKEVVWPDNEQFPLNLADYERTTEKEIIKDINNSKNYLIVTGFTSLSYIITFFGNYANLDKLENVRIILGWSPDERVGKNIFSKLVFTKELKEFWLKQGYSILENANAIITLIDLVEKNKLKFKISEKTHLHAKIYIGETHAILGSANFSKNGLTKQIEASIRVYNNPNLEFEKNQYENIAKIADNFYIQGKNFKDGILKLLNQLLKVTTWQEALARAIHELLEPTWYNESVELSEKIKNAELWPIQKTIIGEALSILQEQGCVLIATPTGSGKTKLISILQLILFHWSIEIGRQHKAYSQTVCPPLIIDNWDKEKKALLLAESSPISMGILSFKDLESHGRAKKQIQNANILIIDEAHNYLSTNSQRSLSISGNKADNIILSTATPINKKSKDLLRIIELLGIDNLDHKQLSAYKSLVKNNFLTSSGFEILKRFISKFIVRQTKSKINESIKADPEKYINRKGERYKYPEKNYKTYPTKENEEDKRIAKEINDKAERLLGIIYLTKIIKPDTELDYSEETYVRKRIESANRLASYNVRSTMRSSKVALVEHIEGTEAATSFFNFKTSKSASGNIIAKIEKLIQKNKLPKKEYSDSYFPDWLNDIELYKIACLNEIKIYKEINALTKRLSDRREEAKVERIIDLFNNFPLIIAFDNTVITLDYLNKVIKSRYPHIESYVATGKTDKTPILKKFSRESRDKNILALCSDTLSEGVNLQGASVVFFLDTPSVLRAVEQRIGRIDRLDSLQPKVEIYFPNDSDEFALKTDIKLLKTLIESSYLLGNNIDLPKETFDRYEEQIIKSKKIIELLREKEKEKEDTHWKDFHDAYKSIRELYEGSNEVEPLIKKETFDSFDGINVETKVKLSIGHCDKSWIFLALRGTKASPLRWFFVDADQNIETDLPKICSNLRSYLTITSKWEDKWIKETDTLLKKYINLLKNKERENLPTRRKNVLNTAESILNKMRSDKNLSVEIKILLDDILKIFKPNLNNLSDEYAVNFYLFSQQWLDIFNDELLKRRINRTKRNTVISVLDFEKDSRTIIEKLTFDKLKAIKENIPMTEKIWDNIASCIIALPIN